MKLAFESDYEYFKNGCFNCQIYRCIELQMLVQKYKKLYLNQDISFSTYLSVTRDFKCELFEIKRSCDKLEAERNLRGGNNENI